jgi:hypothetical protein
VVATISQSVALMSAQEKVTTCSWISDRPSLASKHPDKQDYPC